MIHLKRFLCAAAMAALLLGAWGCCKVTCPDPASLVGVETIVADYNHNADKVPYLWSRAHVKILIHDPGSGVPVFRYGDLVGDFNGLVLLEKDPENPAGPANFLLKVGEPGGNTVFALGNSLVDGMYHLWYRKDEPVAWVGPTDLAGAPGTSIPIDPLLLANVFTIKPLPDLKSVPVVTQRIQTQCECAYILTYAARQPVSQNILARGEYVFPWLPKGPGKLQEIRFFDPVGMVALRAEVGDYRTMDTSTLQEPPETPALLAHRIKLTAYDAKTRKTAMTMEIHLENASTKFVLYPAACRLDNAMPPDVRSQAKPVEIRRPQ